MIKSELIEVVSKMTSNVTKKDIKVIVEVIFDSMVEALKKGEKIEIRGLGSFKVKSRETRYGRNPKTGVRVKIPENKALSFKMGKELRERVGSQKLKSS